MAPLRAIALQRGVKRAANANGFTFTGCLPRPGEALNACILSIEDSGMAYGQGPLPILTRVLPGGDIPSLSGQGTHPTSSKHIPK